MIRFELHAELAEYLLREGPRGEIRRRGSVTKVSERSYMEVGSFEKTLHNFIREGSRRSSKGVDKRLI